VTIVAWAKMPRACGTIRALGCVKLFSLTSIFIIILFLLFQQVEVAGLLLALLPEHGCSGHARLVGAARPYAS
jgi:hypothetical protein